MVILKKTGKLSIDLIIDKKGGEYMLLLLNSLLEQKGYEDMIVDFDNAVVSSKNKQSVEKKIALHYCCDKYSFFEKSYERIIWHIDHEDIEYMTERLVSCGHEKMFYPSELLMLKVPRNREGVTLYGVYNN